MVKHGQDNFSKRSTPCTPTKRNFDSETAQNACQKNLYNET